MDNARSRALLCHAPNAILVMGTEQCPFCKQAKAALDKHGLSYEWRDIEADPGSFSYDTVPQIWVGEHHIGGYSELEKALQCHKIR